MCTCVRVYGTAGGRAQCRFSDRQEQHQISPADWSSFRNLSGQGDACSNSSDCSQLHPTKQSIHLNRITPYGDLSARHKHEYDSIQRTLSRTSSTSAWSVSACENQSRGFARPSNGPGKPKHEMGALDRFGRRGYRRWISWLWAEEYHPIC